MPSPPFRFSIGADENGMGPRLGPMLVTAVLARTEDGAEGILGRKPRGGLAKRLGDSKGLVAHGDVALAEAWARVLVARGAGRHGDGRSPATLLDALSLDDHDALTAPCPRHVEGQCWGTRGERFAPEEETAGLVKAIGRDLDRLEKRGVHIVAVRSVIVCTRRLNEAIERGQSRFVVDLHCMERLILKLRAVAGEDVDAVCGKVGGFGQYSKAFGPLAGHLHSVLEEGRRRSAYHFPGVGQIAFVQDSDASNLLVGMASLVGKYLRELTMDRIVRYYRAEDEALPQASGYHDPITRRFVVGSEALRRRRRIPDTCFERGRLPSPPRKR